MEPTPGQQLAESLGDLLRRTTRARIYGTLTAGLDPAIDEATYPVISGLARFGPCTAAQLAEDLGIDRSVASRHATRLHRAGLLTRVPDPDDGRGRQLVLTAEGNRAVATMRTRLGDILDTYLAAWPPQQAREFAAGLRRFVEDLRAPSPGTRRTARGSDRNRPPGGLEATK